MALAIRHVQNLFLVPGQAATLLHLPHGLVQRNVLCYLSPTDLMSYRAVCLFAQEDAEVVLMERAREQFGVPDALVYALLKSFERRNELLINKGDAKAVFRVTDGDLESLPREVEKHYRWCEYKYRVEDVVRAALKRFKSVRQLMKIDATRKVNQVSFVLSLFFPSHPHPHPHPPFFLFFLSGP